MHWGKIKYKYRKDMINEGINQKVGYNKAKVVYGAKISSIFM